MKIDIASFLNPLVYYGGGEMIVRRLIEVGRQRGHDIRITSVRPNTSDCHSSPDLTIVNDIFNHGHSYRSLGAWRSFSQNKLMKIIEQKKFIHLNNAYGDICNLPYLPCSGHSASICPHKVPHSYTRKVLLKDWDNSCFASRNMIRHLHSESLLDVFLSPLHLATTEQILKTKLPRTYIVPPLIDTATFRNHGLERDIEYLFVGVIGEAKGLENLRLNYAHTDIHLIGKCAPGAVVDFGHWVGHVPYDQIPLWMNRAKNFVFEPRWPEPQGRVVCEAALCGCNIIGNNHVGALSFDFDLADPRNYDNVEARFWEKIEEII